MPVITVASVMQRAAAEPSELGRLAKEAMDQSKVSDELLLALLRIQIPQMDLRKGFVLVDFPKNAGQADVLDGMLSDLGASIELVLNLEVDRDDLMERLVGRIERIEIGGFALAELGADAVDTLWRRGGFPRSYLARSERDSVVWRKQFIQTLLERDFPQWGVRVPAVALLRFWTMVAHYHGQLWNAAEPARALGVSPSTMRRYLDLLTDALVLRQLQPWHANLGKRQVRSPEIHVRDRGLLHHLPGLARDGQRQLRCQDRALVADRKGLDLHFERPRRLKRHAVGEHPVRLLGSDFAHEHTHEPGERPLLVDFVGDVEAADQSPGACRRRP